jgi:hypothetical protein
VLEKAHPFVMSFLFGIPMGYAEHHLGMHHVEDNMPEDLSSTMRYRRDSFLHFLHYFGRFFFLILVELPIYLAGKRRTRWRGARSSAISAPGARRRGSSSTGASASSRSRSRYVTVRFLMMTGNWGQHAFVNTARKNDGLSNSITCINSGYNKRAFNDGYHIGHHLKGNRHWTELPKELPRQPRCVRARGRRRVRGARLLHRVGAALDGPVEGAREALRAARRQASQRRGRDRDAQIPGPPHPGRRRDPSTWGTT